MASQIKESASCEFVDSDVIEIVSADEYDAHRAKLRSSLSWLISKVYGSQPPNDLKDPFYENSEGQLVLRPVMVNLLSSSELYCQACSNMFPETHTQWRGHWSIIQVLSRKGIYIQDIQDTAVTETVLVQTAPFRLKAHLSLMDALMKAYSCEVASVEKVVKAVRNITAFPASSELPGTTEEALTFWVNKVCAALTSDPVLSDGQLLEGETAQKVRIVSKSTSPRDPVKVPPMEDLMRDVGDGCNVAALIAYYRPGQLNIRDVCLKDSIGIADSLYNLRQIGQFCRNHLPWRSFHLSYEDLLYTHDSMRVNILTFLADLFYCFEGPGASLANGNPGSIEQDRLEAMPAAGKRSAQTAVPKVPISGATKKSFQRLPFEDTASNLGMGRSSLTSPSSHQPLLPRRSGSRRSSGQSQPDGTSEYGASPPSARRTSNNSNRRRVQSLSSPQDRELVHRSVLAWQDDQRLPHRYENRRHSQERGDGSHLLAKVSIDSELNQSLATDTSLSLDLRELDTPRQGGRGSTLDPSHPDYLEVESVTSGQPSRFTSPHPPSSAHQPATEQPHSSLTSSPLSSRDPRPPAERLEPLMPAQLRPTKEREVSLSKAEERGDKTPRRTGRKSNSPTEPQSPSPSPTGPSPSPTGPPPPDLGGSRPPGGRSKPECAGDEDGVSLSSSSTGTCVTPLPPGESQSPRYTERGGQSRGQVPPGRPYEAFLIGGDSSTELSLLPRSNEQTPPNSARSAAQSVAESYTVEDRATSAQAARAAGIPVVIESGELPMVKATQPDARLSREGSVCSSGEFSDHESQKIHQDHKVRESGVMSRSDGGLPAVSDVHNDSGYLTKPTMMVISDQLGTEGPVADGPRTKMTKITKSSSGGMTTNFAELKRLKDELGRTIDKVDNSALIYMQSGGHGGPQDKATADTHRSPFFLKPSQGQSQGSQPGRLAGVLSPTTAALPDNSSTSDPATDNNSSNVVGGGVAGSSPELSQLRLKLEQKRKEIERKKHRMEAQQNKMRQRLGKAAFMRVVSKHLDTGEDDQMASPAPDGPHSSMQADIQARLGQPGPRLPLGPGARGHHNQPQTHATAAQLRGQGAAIAADTSANRFTDWRTQSQLSRAVSGDRGGGGDGGGGGDAGGSSAAAAQRPVNLQQQQQQQQMVLPRGADGNSGRAPSEAGSDSSGSSQKSSGSKAFSREGMQQTIDKVKNNWFHNDLITGGGGVGGGGGGGMRGAGSEEDVDVLDGDIGFARGPGGYSRASSASPQSGGDRGTPPRAGAGVGASQLATSAPVPCPPRPASRESSSSPHAKSDSENYQEYDSSLDKLNNSLTELQGEIMRLSLQHEQLKAAQSPQGGGPEIPSGFEPRMSDALAAIGSNEGLATPPPPSSSSSSSGSASGRPIHGIPPQAAYQQHAALLRQQQSGSPSPGPQQQVPYANNSNSSGTPQFPPSPHHAVADVDSNYETPGAVGDGANSDNQNKDGGFFVSFGDDATPKRSKPRLSDRRGVSPAPQTPQRVGPGSLTKVIDEADVVPGHAIDVLPPQKGDDSGAPALGFLIKDQEAEAKKQAGGDEMQKKKQKLMEMQRKRKEEQERRRVEKEVETARKQEQKMMKEEEAEKKKVEERTRREAIFQQYLQRKQQDDEEPNPTPPVKHRKDKRNSSGSRPRPKSMMAKTKPMTPEPGAIGGLDSGSSSQEDLTGGRAAPGIMSMSCNQLPQNGASPGPPSTYRRPPSPDMYRLRQQRQPANSQDSGSETGSGSYQGSEFAGPKLYVKPSAKSNRHIIVNAISHCCLAGCVNTDMKNKVLEEMSKCEANHFLILFRDAGCQYRALFIFSPDTEEAFKVHGVGPKHISNKMCEKFYKYNSGGKSFTEITSTKHLSVSVDAVVLHGSVWKSGKAAVRR